MTEKNALAQSDEDFLASAPPPDSPIERPPAVEPEPPVEEAVTEPPVEPVTSPQEDTAVEDANALGKPDGEVTDPPAEDKTTPKDGDGAAAKPGDEAKPQEPGAEAAAAEPVNYETAYKELLAPIKANGKELVLKDVEQARRYIQMGAGFQKRMQELAPARAAHESLKAHGLTADDIPLLADLKKGNPAAIQRLIADHKLNPLDFSEEGGADYRPPAQAVTEKDIAFNDVVDEINALPHGQELISEIDRDWDVATKGFIYDKPQYLRAFVAQKANGIYGAITSEMERLRSLGQLDDSKPFMDHYTEVGQALQASGGFNHLADAKPTTPATPSAPTQTPAAPAQQVVVATRTEAPKGTVANGDKARAAAPTPSATRPTGAKVNPLSVSDDDFMKQAEASAR